MTKLLHLLRDQKAATAIEYGLIAALIFLAAMGAIIFLGDVTVTMWNDIAAKSSEAMGPR